MKYFAYYIAKNISKNSCNDDDSYRNFYISAKFF